MTKMKIGTAATALALTLGVATFAQAQTAGQPRESSGQQGASGTGTTNPPDKAGAVGNAGGGTVPGGVTGSSQGAESRGQQGASGTGTTNNPARAGSTGSGGGGTVPGGSSSAPPAGTGGGSTGSAPGTGTGTAPAR